MDTVNILGVKIAAVDIMQAADRIMQMTEEEGVHSVYTPNSEIVLNAYKDNDFCKLLNRADLLVADGIGVVYASKFVKKPLKSRAAGFDIAMELLPRLAKQKKKLFLFGSKPGIAEKAAEIFCQRNPGLVIAGCRNGYFSPDENDEIVAEINASGADVVFVCLGAPAQEKWIDKNKDALNVKVLMGIGGSLDAVTGNMPRAPKWWQDHGVEWLYRLIKQPKRFFRMLALPKFAVTVFANGRKFPQD